MTASYEVILVRDPDGETSLQLFADGVRVPFDEIAEYVIDAGHGYTWDDWKDSRDWALQLASTRAVRNALLDAYADPPGGQYVDKPADVEWLDGVQ